jgi:hypothetical protein
MSTYRELAWSRLVEVVDAAATTPAATARMPSLLQELRRGFDAAIDVVPELAALLDRSESAGAVDTPAAADNAEGTVDPINRADDIVAQIAGKLDHR